MIATRLLARNALISQIMLPVALGAVLLSFWELGARTLINPFWFSSPGRIAGRFWQWLVDGTLAYHMWITLQEVTMGFVIGCVIAFLLAYFFNELPFLMEVVDPIIIAIYGMPKIALAPLFIMWFGIGMSAKVYIAAFIVFFVVFYQVINGLRNVDKELIKVVKLMGAGKRDLYAKVYVPAARIWLVSALRLGFPKAFHGAIIGEIMSSNRGIGFLTMFSTGNFDTTGALTALFAMLCVTLPIHYLFGSLGDTKLDESGGV
jgi:NitT/TauT family transport system permease protein